MKIEVSLGEVLDRQSILQLKLKNINHPGKVNNLVREHEMLTRCVKGLKLIDFKHQVESLYEINKELWEAQDKIRAKEVEKAFDKEFVELARSIYRLNDRRNAIKREVNILSGSHLFEEKQYTPY